MTQPTNELATFTPPRLPYHPHIETAFGITKAAWKTLTDVLYRNATTPDSVVLVLSYCKSRNLDPMKKPVHIVPIWDKDRRCLVDTVWPGIGELRTTAFRTGQYAGRDAAEFGETLTEELGGVEVTYPEWCSVTVYRMVNGQRVQFAGPRVYWKETYATAKRDTDAPNEMWATRSFGQIEKCAEAASLRATFPEEIGSGDYIPEEIEHNARLRNGAADAAEDKAASTQAAIEALKPRTATTALGSPQTSPRPEPPSGAPDAADEPQDEPEPQEQAQDAPSGEESQETSGTDAEQPQVEVIEARRTPAPRGKPQQLGLSTPPPKPWATRK